MKRLIVLLAVVMVAMTIHAGVFGNTRNVSGIVFFLDGHKETFQSITIPYAGDKDFKGIDESGNKRTVKALDVEHLELWHPKYPEESRDVLWSCFDTKANGTKKFVSWSFVTGKGKYISFFTHCGRYVMTKDGLAMVGKNIWPGMTCIKPAVSGIYQSFGWWNNVMGSSKTVVKKLVEKYIFDDPALCKAIQEENWKGRVPELLEFVARTYNPQK